MSELCEKCICEDGIECAYKNNDEPQEHLDPIVVYDTDPPYNYSLFPYDFTDWVSINYSNDDTQYLDVIGSLQVYIDKTRNKVDGYILQLEKDFKRTHKGLTYNEAKLLYDKQLNKPNLKLSPRQIRSIKDALDLDKLKDVGNHVATYGKVLSLANRAELALKLFDAIKDSIQKNNFTILLKAASEIGIGFVLGWSIGLFNPISVTGIVSTMLLYTVCFYLENSYLLPYINNLIDESIEKEEVFHAVGK
ncbi:hypothetical protein [Lonepinella sp. BR2904]|uniref:hypothetical protein n=1 Tax=Lonepinella sp. BR2904 TaxID=3434551 RepID=UPI003F6DB0CF